MLMTETNLKRKGVNIMAEPLLIQQNQSSQVTMV